MKKYFACCEWGQLSLYETEEEAKADAQKRILRYLDNGVWDQCVDSVCWGEVKEKATQSDLIIADELSPEQKDERGYNPDCTYYCNYTLKPITE